MASLHSLSFSSKASDLVFFLTSSPYHCPTSHLHPQFYCPSILSSKLRSFYLESLDYFILGMLSYTWNAKPTNICYVCFFCYLDFSSNVLLSHWFLRSTFLDLSLVCSTKLIVQNIILVIYCTTLQWSNLIIYLVTGLFSISSSPE